jgi:hypothetical protein
MEMRQHRLFKRCQLRSVSLIWFGLFDYGEFHNLPMRLEILGVGSMLRFHWQSHSDFGEVQLGAALSIRIAISLTRLSSSRFIPFIRKEIPFHRSTFREYKSAKSVE